MKLLKDKKIIALISILLVFTIGYFVIVNKISYAFAGGYNPEDLYKTTFATIEKSAAAYGQNHLDLFKDKDIAYIKVQDLIDNHLLVTDELGNISNPLDESETLNSKVIKLKYANEKVTVEVDI